MARAKKVTAPVSSNEVVEAVEPVVVESAGKSMLAQLVSQVVNAEPVIAERKAKSDKNDGVGLFIRKLIAEGLGNKEILGIVHEQYGNKNTTYACVAWYRNKMKKAGQQVQKAGALDFVTNFAKANGLSEEAVEELSARLKVA